LNIKLSKLSLSSVDKTAQLKHRLWQRVTQFECNTEVVIWVEICVSAYCETLISLFVHCIISTIVRQISVRHFPVLQIPVTRLIILSTTSLTRFILRYVQSQIAKHQEESTPDGLLLIINVSSNA